MSDLSARQRLDTPRTSRRRFAFNVDAEAVGQFSESIARFLGTGRYLAWQTILVIVWILLNLFARDAAVGSRTRSSCSTWRSRRRPPTRRR